MRSLVLACLAVLPSVALATECRPQEYLHDDLGELFQHSDFVFSGEGHAGLIGCARATGY